MNARALLQQAAPYLSVAQQELLCEYVSQLMHWNKAYNLTALTDPHDIWVKHIFDSLSVREFITGSTVLDVGTGAGLPGIVLAILFPEKKITLLDSNGKKTRFLTQIIYGLKLPSVTVFQSRVENFTGQFEHIISRAFSSLGQFVTLTEHLCAPRGEWLAMKGDVSVEELNNLSFSSTVIPLQVPELQAARSLVRVTIP